MKLLKILFLSCLILFPKIAFADAAQYVQWGSQMLNQKKYDDAMKYFSGAIKADAKNAVAYKGMGYALMGKGENDKALPYLKYSSQLNPSDTALKQMIASLGGSTTNMPPGPAQSADPAAVAYQNGERYMQAQQYSYAAYSFDQATKADPNSAKSWAGLGAAFYAQNAKDKAMAAWEKSLALDPSNTQLAQYVSSLKQAGPAPATASPAPAPAEAKQAFNPWILGSTVAALGVIMLFVF
jgi:tetratricopeptide (TPR) repeat protein